MKAKIKNTLKFISTIILLFIVMEGYAMKPGRDTTNLIRPGWDFKTKLVQKMDRSMPERRISKLEPKLLNGMRLQNKPNEKGIKKVGRGIMYLDRFPGMDQGQRLFDVQTLSNVKIAPIIKVQTLSNVKIPPIAKKKPGIIQGQFPSNQDQMGPMQEGQFNEQYSPLFEPRVLKKDRSSSIGVFDMGLIKSLSSQSRSNSPRTSRRDVYTFDNILSAVMPDQSESMPISNKSDLFHNGEISSFVSERSFSGSIE